MRYLYDEAWDSAKVVALLAGTLISFTLERYLSS